MNNQEEAVFYKELRERVHELRIAYLFEECFSCPLYEEVTILVWDSRMTYDHEDNRRKCNAYLL